eukprot:9284251-Lingulodinium_polyedra.AAC.1
MRRAPRGPVGNPPRSSRTQPETSALPATSASPTSCQPAEAYRLKPCRRPSRASTSHFEKEVHEGDIEPVQMALALVRVWYSAKMRDTFSR